MALSNILREPRREITETLVGIAVIAGPVYADWRWSGWFMQQCHNPENDPGARIIGFMLGIVIAVVGYMVVLAIHAFGDAICDSLENRGIRLRPTQRYR